MELEKKHALLGIGIIIIVALGVNAIPNRPLGDNDKDVNDYGTIELISEGITVNSLDTILASDGLEVIWTATVSTSDIHAYLYTATGFGIEEGVHAQSGNIHTFTFTLDGAPEGTTELYVAFGGQYTSDIGWRGATVHFYVEQDATPSFPAPEFTSYPDNMQLNAGESAHLQWWFIYTGPATARITVDGVTVASRATTQISGEQPLSYDVSFALAGLHKVKLIIEPEYDIPYANEVLITVIGQSNTTTTTSSTTTTSTSTEEPLLSDFMLTAISAGIFIAVIVLIAYVQLRGRSE